MMSDSTGPGRGSVLVVGGDPARVHALAPGNGRVVHAEYQRQRTAAGPYMMAPSRSDAADADAGSVERDPSGRQTVAVKLGALAPGASGWGTEFFGSPFIPAQMKAVDVEAVAAE